MTLHPTYLGNWAVYSHELYYLPTHLTSYLRNLNLSHLLKMTLWTSPARKKPTDNHKSFLSSVFLLFSLVSFTVLGGREKVSRLARSSHQVHQPAQYYHQLCWSQTDSSTQANLQAMSTALEVPALSPPTAMLPPPPQSSSNRSPLTSESSRKRRRDESVGSSRSNFSESTKDKLSRLYGGLCWQCGAAAAIHNCHVIAQKDRAVSVSTLTKLPLVLTCPMVVWPLQRTRSAHLRITSRSWQWHSVVSQLPRRIWRYTMSRLHFLPEQLTLLHWLREQWLWAADGESANGPPRSQPLMSHQRGILE